MDTPITSKITYAVISLSDKNGTSKLAICQELSELAKNENYQSYMTSPESGLLSALKKVLIRDDDAVKACACEIIYHLTTSPENQLSMTSSHIGLLPILLDIIKDTKGDAMIHSCGAIMNLACASENQIYMASPELGLLSVLVNVLQDDKGQARIWSCGALMNIALAPENEVLMASSELGLLPALINILHTDQGEARMNACRTILNISFSLENKIYLASSTKLNLLPILVNIIRINRNEIRIKALSIIMNISSAIENQNIIISSELNLLQTFVDILQEYGEDIDYDARLIICKILSNIIENASTETIHVILRTNIPSIMLELLREAGSDPSVWEYSYPSKIITFFMNFCRFNYATKLMKNMDLNRIIQPLLLLSNISTNTTSTTTTTDDDNIESIKALFICVFLLGSDEIHKGYSTQLSQINPNFIHILIEIYENTLNSKGGNNYPLGIFRLNLIIGAILTISISDANKSDLISSALLPLLARSLEMFVLNTAPIEKCGGGGSDFEVIQLVIEVLLQLSFFYENDSDLCSKYITTDVNVSILLQKILILQKERLLLPFEVTRNVFHLLKRLQFQSIVPRRKKSDINITNFKKKHIMISYINSIKKDLVIEFCRQLRGLGFDIWRDEEGSSLVPALFGSTDEHLIDAIEHSFRLIICVSKEYKQSAYCRIQAKYAYDLFRKGKLSIEYVMMDESYHTNSSPDVVDGWLGLMLADSHWHKLWDVNHINATAKHIADLPPDHGVLVVKQSPRGLPPLGPSPPSLSSLSSLNTTTCDMNTRKLHTSASLGSSEMTKKLHPTASLGSLPLGGKRNMTMTTMLSSLTTGTGTGNSVASHDMISVQSDNDNDDDDHTTMSYTPIELVWLSLHDMNRLLNEERKDALLAELGIVEASNLLECDSETLQQLSLLFKPIARKTFLKTIKSICAESVWDSLHDPSRVLDPSSMENLLCELGIIESNNLIDCDIESFKAMSILFKPIAKKVFINAIKSISLASSSIESIWSSLYDPSRVANITSMENLLSELGIVEAQDLFDCDVESISKLAVLFKPVARRTFLKAIENSSVKISDSRRKISLSLNFDDRQNVQSNLLIWIKFFPLWDWFLGEKTSIMSTSRPLDAF
eukprot:gene7896-16166_t